MDARNKTAARSMQTDIKPQKKRFPNLGTTSVIIRFLLGAEMVAIILTLARNAEPNLMAWNDFLMWTAFALTTALGVILVAKLISVPLQRLGSITGSILALIILVAVSLGVYEALTFLLHFLGVTPTRWPKDHASTLVRLGVVNTMVIALVIRFTTVDQSTRSKEETQKQDRLQALQSRIRPHFLFNSMNSVASLIRSDPDLAEKALQDLADVFRVLLADARKMVPITAEGELARQYLDIEKLRLGDRLQVKWTASNVPRSALIPSLTLQPLLENAVYHGIEPSFAGGTVDIQLWSEGEDLKVMISNPVPEVTNQAQQRKGNRIAMDNVRERLNQHFGGRATLQNIEQEGNYHVKISMPIVRG